ncbi:CarD-like/TRCF domain protein [compost metagenome]
MYRIGDYIIYGNSGVCQIKAIGSPNISLSVGSKQYYTLSAIYSTETIYTPVDTKIFMRPVITREEATKLIEQIPDIEEEAYDQYNTKWLANLYESFLQKNNCRVLIKLIKTIYIKNYDAIQNKKKISDTDQRYLKRAEDLLYSEFSVALEMNIEDVKQHVEAVVEEQIL